MPMEIIAVIDTTRLQQIIYNAINRTILSKTDFPSNIKFTHVKI